MADVSFPPGVSRGATPAERQGRWWDANNVRWRDAKLQPIGGNDRITERPFSSPVRRLLAVKDNTDVHRLFAGCDNHLMLLEGSALRDITPAGFTGPDFGDLPDGYGVGLYGGEDYGAPRAQGEVALLRTKSVWHMDSWGEDLMAVAASDGRVLRWSPKTANDPAAPIPNAPTGVRGLAVTQERHLMVLGASGFPRRVAWSAREDYNDWNFADQISTAGYLELDSEGLLVAMAEVRDGTLVFSDNDVWLIQYVGQPFVYGRQRVGSSTSLLSPQAVAVFDGKAAWLGKNSFFLYDAGQCRPLPSEVSAFVFADIDPLYGPLFAHASANGSFSEIWWFYPSRGSPVCDRYVVWNYLEDWWSLGAMARTAWMPKGVGGLPVAAGADNHLYEHETGWTDAGLSRVGKVWVESAAMGGGGQSAVLRGQLDSGVGIDATAVNVKARQTRDGPDRVFGPYRPNPDGRVAMRAGGADLRLRLEARADGEWSVGRMSFDVVNVGNR